MENEIIVPSGVNPLEWLISCADESVWNAYLVQNDREIGGTDLYTGAKGEEQRLSVEATHADQPDYCKEERVVNGKRVIVFRGYECVEYWVILAVDKIGLYIADY